MPAPDAAPRDAAGAASSAASPGCDAAVVADRRSSRSRRSSSSPSRRRRRRMSSALASSTRSRQVEDDGSRPRARAAATTPCGRVRAAALARADADPRRAARSASSASARSAAAATTHTSSSDEQGPAPARCAPGAGVVRRARAAPPRTPGWMGDRSPAARRRGEGAQQAAWVRQGPCRGRTPTMAAAIPAAREREVGAPTPIDRQLRPPPRRGWAAGSRSEAVRCVSRIAARPLNTPWAFQ